MPAGSSAAEVGDLDLHPPFRRQWEIRRLARHRQEPSSGPSTRPGKSPSSRKPHSPSRLSGSRWPYPHRADGAEWPDAGPGAVPGASAGGEPPNQINDMAEPEPHDTLEPRGGDDGKMPSRGRKPNPPADAFPDQGERARRHVAYAADHAHARRSIVGAPKSGGNDSGHPVVGSVPAKTPKPMSPHAVEPEVYDPAEAVEDWSPEAGSDVVHDVGKGAQHVTDANPVEWRHVYAVMESNFPDSALEWVKHSTWHGPVHVPWSRIDDDDIGKWAAATRRTRLTASPRDRPRRQAHRAVDPRPRREQPR